MTGSTGQSWHDEVPRTLESLNGSRDTVTMKGGTLRIRSEVQLRRRGFFRDEGVHLRGSNGGKNSEGIRKECWSSTMISFNIPEDIYGTIFCAPADHEYPQSPVSMSR